MIKPGQTVKLNPSLFVYPSVNAALYGEVGYPESLKLVTWEVARTERHEKRGEIAHCRAISGTGEAILQIKDLVAVMK